MKRQKLKNEWDAIYIGSYVSTKDLPKKKLPGIAVIGRSNVGKSTLINALTKQKGLARVSASPGKTQTLNFYEINEEFYLVDMPGYGYAKVSKEKRGDWSDLSSTFLAEFEQLLTLLILIDSNIPFQSIDQKFIEWCGENQIPFIIIRTKSDKSKPRELEQLQLDFEKTLKESWEELPLIIRHSGTKNIGHEDIKKELQRIVTEFKITG